MTSANSNDQNFMNANTNNFNAYGNNNMQSVESRTLTISDIE
jgi:hypothetical protein